MQHLYSFAKSFLSLACLVLFLGTGAAFAQTDLFFGDGSDKDVTISIDTTLDHDMYYHNLTITSGKILYPDGFRIFVSGTLTLEDGARISRDGNDAARFNSMSLIAGAYLSSGTLGGAGGYSSAQRQAAVTNSLGGSGGGLGGEASPPGMSAGGVGVFRSALQALGGRSLDGALVYGGAGGFGGSVFSGRELESWLATMEADINGHTSIAAMLTQRLRIVLPELIIPCFIFRHYGRKNIGQVHGKLRAGHNFIESRGSGFLSQSRLHVR